MVWGRSRLLLAAGVLVALASLLAVTLRGRPTGGSGAPPDAEMVADVVDGADLPAGLQATESPTVAHPADVPAGVVTLPAGWPTPALLESAAAVEALVRARLGAGAAVQSLFVRRTHERDFWELTAGRGPGFTYDPAILPVTPTPPRETPDPGAVVWVVGVRTAAPVSERTVDRVMPTGGFGLTGQLPEALGREFYFVVDDLSNVSAGGMLDRVDEDGRTVHEVPWALEDIMTLPEAR